MSETKRTTSVERKRMQELAGLNEVFGMGKKKDKEPNPFGSNEAEFIDLISVIGETIYDLQDQIEKGDQSSAKRTKKTLDQFMKKFMKFSL